MHAIFFPLPDLFLLKLLRNYFSRCDLHCFRTCNFMYLDDTQQWRNAKPKDPSALVSLLFSQLAFKCLFFCRSLSLSFSLSFLEASGKECLMKHHLDLTRKRVGEKRRKGEFGSRVRERICTSQSWSKAFVLFLFFSLNFRKIEFNRGSYSIRLD